MIFLVILRWIGIVLLFLLGLILVFSLIPIHLKIRYDEDFSAQLKILFFKKNLFPGQKEDEGEEESEEDQEEKPKKEKDKSKIKPSINEIFTLMQESLSIIAKSLKFFCKGIRFRHMEILWRINAGEADVTAQLYGKIQMATGILLGLMLELFNVKKYRVHLEPDFLEEGTLFRAKADLSFRLITLILLIPRVIQLYFKYSHWKKALQTKNESVEEKTQNPEVKVTENP